MKGDRFERLEVLRQEAADRLRLPIEHDKTQLLAALRLNHESMVERLVAGHTVNPDQLLALSEAIDKLTPELPPQKIEIEIVSGVVGLFTCQHCHQQNRIENYTEPPKKDYPRTIDAEPVKADEAKALSSPVEVKPEPKHPGSIHNAVLPDGTPARMRRNDYSGISTVDSPLRERPNFEAHHPLPMPKGYCW